MNKKTYVFEVCIPLLHTNNPFEVTSELREVLAAKFGAHSPSSGAGFGFRDVQFEFNTEAAAWHAFKFAVRFLEDKGYESNEVEVNGVWEDEV